MGVVDSLREHVKELYNDCIEKLVLPTVLAGTLAFTACGPSAPPTPTPIPTPNPITADLVCYSGWREENKRPRQISLNYQNPVQCLKSNNLVLKFEAGGQVPTGDTLAIPVFVSSQVYNGSSVSINYSKQGWRQEPGMFGEHYNIEMRTLAKIPVDREVVLKFKSEAGLYDFFIPGINFLEPEVRWPTRGTYNAWHAENKGVIGRVCVGTPVDISIKSDVKEVPPYNSVLISGSRSGIDYFRVEITKDGRHVESFNVENARGNYSINWLPKESGSYKVITAGHYDCFKSVSEPLTIVVKE